MADMMKAAILVLVGCLLAFGGVTIGNLWFAGPERLDPEELNTPADPDWLLNELKSTTLKPFWWATPLQVKALKQAPPPSR